MIKQLLINGEGNRYTLSNRARQAIAFQYITDTKTLRLIDTYNNVAVDLVADGDNALTSSAMQSIWSYIQNKVDDKVGGAFKFRGTVNSLDEVENPKPGDVYQIKVETAQYDPKTGQVIPSSLANNDKEFAWAVKEDGTGQWVELGFNYEGGAATEQWVKDYFVGQFQQKDVLCGIIAHTQLSTQLQTREEAIAEHNEIYSTISSTASSIYNYVDQQTGNTEELISNVSSSILDYINNTFSTSIINYIDEQINKTNITITNLSTTFNQKTNALSTAIDNVHDYVDQKNNELSAAVRNKISDLSATVDGKFVTLTNTFDTKIRTLSTSFNSKINNVSAFFDHRFNSLETDLNNKITNLDNKVDEKDSFLSTSIDNLTNLVNEKDQALSTAIDNLNTDLNNKFTDLNVLMITKDNALSAAIDDLSSDLNDKYEELLNKHNTDMSFVQYDENGDPIP